MGNCRISKAALKYKLHVYSMYACSSIFPAMYHHIAKMNTRRTYHSIASSRPSPFNADVLNMDHVLFFSADKPNAVETSVADIEPSMS